MNQSIEPYIFDFKPQPVSYYLKKLAILAQKKRSLEKLPLVTLMTNLGGFFGVVIQVDEAQNVINFGHVGEGTLNSFSVIPFNSVQLIQFDDAYKHLEELADGLLVVPMSYEPVTGLEIRRTGAKYETKLEDEGLKIKLTFDANQAKEDRAANFALTTTLKSVIQAIVEVCKQEDGKQALMKISEVVFDLTAEETGVQKDGVQLKMKISLTETAKKISTQYLVDQIESAL